MRPRGSHGRRYFEGALVEDDSAGGIGLPVPRPTSDRLLSALVSGDYQDQDRADNGKVSRKQAPPRWERQTRSPPWARASARAMGKPSPAPP
jgi:hypothetical protein